MTNALNKPDFGILLLRLLLGGLMAAHGVMSLMKGQAAWTFMGDTLKQLGIVWMPMIWGLATCCVQAIGGLFFMMGLFFRWACFALVVVMSVAVFRHIIDHESLMMEGGQALVFAIIFLGFLFIGPGSYTPKKVA